jgi:site-specific DNA-methyltransferase (adenine-specific)
MTDEKINQDIFEVLGFLPEGFVDLLILDPPYNLNKTFTSTTFRKGALPSMPNGSRACWSNYCRH